MIFSKTIVLTVDGYSVNLSDSLKFYQNDKIKLIFVIKRLRNTNIHPHKGYLLLENPNGVDKIESMETEGNTVTFYLDSKNTNFIGVSRMQIILVDKYGGQITLPYMNFEVQKNIYGDIQTVESVVTSEKSETLLTNSDEYIISGINLE